MSYDLAVFRPSKTLTRTELATVYAALCEATKAKLPIEPGPSIARLYAQLVETWPELADAEDEDSTPWAAKLDRSKRHLLLPMSSSFVSDVMPRILAMASALGLDVFDPQTRKHHRAADAKAAKPTKAGPRRLSRKEIDTGLAEGLARAARKHDFVLVPVPIRSFIAFVREPRADIRQWLMVQSGYSPTTVRLWIRVQADELTGAIGDAWPCETGPFAIDSDLLAYYRDPDGRVTLRPEILERLSYDACHDTCLAKALPKLAKDIDQYAIPALARLATIADLDAALNAPASNLPHYLSGYHASRFVQTALAKLTKRKDFPRIVEASRIALKKNATWHDAKKPVLKAYEALVARLRKSK